MASLWTNIAPKSVITPPQNGATFDPSSVMSSLFPIDMVPSAVLDYSVREHSLNSSTPALLPQADLKSRPREKKTKGRVKIKMEFIDDKQKRLTSFSKRKAGLLKKVRIYPNFGMFFGAFFLMIALSHGEFCGWKWSLDFLPKN